MPPVSKVRCYLFHLLLVTGLWLQTWLLYKPPATTVEPAHWDKAVHGFMFGLPAGLALWLGYRWAPAFFAAYAPVSELIQGTSWVKRDADIRDVVADITGIMLISWAVASWRRRKVR